MPVGVRPRTFVVMTGTARITEPGRVPNRAAATADEWGDWRWQTRHRVRSSDALSRALGGALSAQEPVEGAAERVGIEAVTARFPVGVSPYYLSLVDPSDPSDPILRQILPVMDEARAAGQEVSDPFGEEDREPVPGVVHRYPDRALIVPTNFCATLCRHCFRKRTWADGFFMLDDRALARAVQYIRETETITDVLVTGGDPIHLPEARLERLLNDLREIPRLDVLRVATRTPVTLPQRLDRRMVDILAAVRPLWLITHFNHAREVTDEARAALRALLDRGVTVQNQAVLLRGVNDHVDAQVELSRAMLRVGVRPYYLHLADPVAGAGHFRLPIDRARSIVKAMHGRISGLGIPRLVLDLPGGKGKVPIESSFELDRDGDQLTFQGSIDGDPVLFVDPPDGS